MDEIAKQLGFENEKEMNSLISSVDMSTPEKVAAFKKWQSEDGTKDGILKLAQLP